MQRALYTDGDRIRSIGLTTPLTEQNLTASSHPGDSFAISGCNLASTTAGADPSQPLPSVLGGTSITLNGIPIPLSFVSPTQIIGRIPGDIASGTATFAISSVNGAANAVIGVN